MCSLKVLDERREDDVSEALWCCDPHLSDEPPTKLLNVRKRKIVGLDGTHRVLHEKITGWRRCNATAGTVEQSHAQSVLNPCNSAANRRLRY